MFKTYIPPAQRALCRAATRQLTRRRSQHLATMSLGPFRSIFNDPFFKDWDLLRPGAGSNDLFNARVDVKSDEKEIQVNAELPGVPKEDINVEFHDGVMTIHGKKEEIKDDKEKHTYERRFGSFSRSIRLPRGVKEENISCKHVDGVLECTIALPPAVVEAEKAAKRIQIE